MAEPRTTWRELPAAVRGSVEALIDTVVSATPISNGLNSPFAARLDTVHGPVFAKGAPEGHPAVAQQAVEAQTSAWQPRSSPRLIAHVVDGGWDVLLLEHVEGRHADLSLESSDLEAIAAALGDQLPAPPHGLVPTYVSWRAEYIEPGEAELLGGDRLVHADLHHENILISPAGAHVVDWAMPVIGPAWLDVAYMVVRLLEWDHSPEAAFAWAARIPVWRDADAVAVAAFAAVEAREWEASAGRQAAPGCERLRILAQLPALR